MHEQNEPKLSATAALKLHGSTLTARRLHTRLLDLGILETVERPSTVLPVTRRYLRFTGFGAWAGVNVPTGRPRGAGAIRFHADRFAELLELLTTQTEADRS